MAEKSNSCPGRASISITWPRPPRYWPSPPGSGAAPCARPRPGPVCFGLDRHGHHARGRRSPTARPAPAARPCRLRMNEIQDLGPPPGLPGDRAHRHVDVPPAAAPSARTCPGSACASAPSTRSGTRCPITCRTETGAGRGAFRMFSRRGDGEGRQRDPVVRDVRRHHAFQRVGGIGLGIDDRHVDALRADPGRSR